MNEQREPLQPLDYLALAAVLIGSLAMAAGLVWMLIQFIRLVLATGYAEQLCGLGLAVIAVVVLTAAVRR